MIPRSRHSDKPESPPLFSLVRLAPKSAHRILMQAPGNLTPEFNRALVAHARNDENASRLVFPEGVRPTDRIAQEISLEQANILLAAMRTTVDGLVNLLRIRLPKSVIWQLGGENCSHRP